MTKILILRFSSIGDIVLTSPVIRCLKMQIPDVEVHFCTKPSFKECLEYNPYIDKIYLLEHRLNDLIKQLAQEKYDYIIDLHHNLRTLIIKKRLGVKSYSFEKLNFKKWLLVKFKINWMPNIHIVQRYLKTVEPLNVKDDEKGLDFFIPEHLKISTLIFPLAFRVGYVAFVIGAQHNTKKMTAEKIIEFARIINQPVVLIGGKQDFALGEKVYKILYDLDIPVQNTCGKYTLIESASLLTSANFIVSNDTGLMHIAAALKKKIFVAWGSTVPSFGMYPYKTEYVNIENNNLPCRPCSKIGFNVCPKKHFNCMLTLNFPGNK
ncbi:MAG: glycosyltransferase family 9 protein [Cytophagales bacterium]|nr:MAG: glycosyltransferase family 9 protein [Cytophagales bacterium]